MNRRNFLSAMTATPLLVTSTSVSAATAPTTDAFEMVNAYCPTCKCGMQRMERTYNLAMDDTPHLWLCACPSGYHRLPYWRKLR